MSSGTTRARIEDLTETQRRVLDLIAEGRTNFEIGQELGITLDGAKYHVTEILNKLGVDSREEAASLVKGGPAASRTLRWVGVAAAVAAAALGMASILALVLDRGESEDADAVYAAFLVGEDGERRQITVVDSRGGSQSVGEPGAWVMLKWSPDAEMLAVLEVDREAAATGGTILHTLRRDGQHAASWPVGTASAPFEVAAWSPDSLLLAVLTSDAVSIHAADGTQVASTGLQIGEPGFISHHRLLWSADSQRVAALDSTGITLLAVSGESRHLPPPAVTERDSVGLFEWRDSVTLRVTTASEQRGPPSQWDADTTAPDIEWQDAGTVDGGQGVEELAEQFAAASNLDPADFRLPVETDDGEALAGLFVAEERQGSARISNVVVRHGDSYTIIEAPADAWWLFTYRAHVAVVVVQPR